MALDKRRVLEELELIAFARGSDYFAVRDGCLQIRESDELPEGAGAAIASVERSAQGLKVKLYDKLKALELLGKHLGLFEGDAQENEEPNDLLQAILDATGKEDGDAVQQAKSQAGAGDDLVEPSGAEKL